MAQMIANIGTMTTTAMIPVLRGPPLPLCLDVESSELLSDSEVRVEWAVVPVVGLFVVPVVGFSVVPVVPVVPVLT